MEKGMRSVKQKNGKSILVVDDNEDIRTLLADHLNEDGYNVVQAKDGNEALLKLKNQSFSLIITDLNMPRLDGIKLTNEVIAMGETPVLLITGELENFETRLKALKNIMLLPKPFRPEIVSMLVNKIIKESKAAEAVAA